MTQTYFAILTAIGEAKDANAKALGIPFKITAMAVGDGGGNVPMPDRSATRLVNEIRRAPLNQLSTDTVNANQIIAEQVIPENVGGWWIRELGLYDADGDLIAIANCPPTYKPQLAEGSGRTQVVRMVLIVSSVNQLELKIDPSVVLATRKYVDEHDTFNLVLLAPGFATSDFTRILRPAGGYFSSPNSTHIGAVQILLPVGYTNTMLAMKLRIYDWGTGGLYNLDIAGYNYAGDHSWKNVKALCACSGNYRQFNVRFGDLGGRCAIWVAEPGTSWSYPQIEVLDVLAAYAGQVKSLTTGWSVSLVAALGTVNALTVTVNDANTLQGAAPSYAATPDTIPVRNSAGKLPGDVLGSANAAYFANVIDSSRDAATVLPNYSPHSVRWDFVTSTTTGSGANYAGVMTVTPYDGNTASTGDASYQLAFGSTQINGRGQPQLRIRNGIDSTWNTWFELWHSGNLHNVSQLANDAAYVTANDVPIRAKRQRYHPDDNTSINNAFSEHGFDYGTAGVGFAGPFISFGQLGSYGNGGASNYQCQLIANYTSEAGHLKFRTQNGDKNVWNPWRTIWHDGNLSKVSQLANDAAYRSTAGILVDVAQIDNITTPGDYLVDIHGATKLMIVSNVGGSVGALQQVFNYDGSFNFRNKTDNQTWTAWKVVLHSGNMTNVSQLANDAGYINKAPPQFGINQVDGAGRGISLYGGDVAGVPTYGLMFARTINYGTHGAVNGDWATYFTMTSDPGRGWVFYNVNSGKIVASISNSGMASFDGRVSSYATEAFRAENDNAFVAFVNADGTRNGYIQYMKGSYAQFMQELGIGMRWGTSGTVWMTLTPSGRLLLGGNDNGVDKMQIAGSLSARDGYRGSWLIPDVRANAATPNNYQNFAATIEFKDADKVDYPPVRAHGGYGYILTVVGYETSGGAGGGTPVQVSFGDGLAVRQANNGTSWGAWRTIWHDGNLNKLSQLSNDMGVFPVGTRMPFAQATAPTGWVQDVSDAIDNRMLRVVSTAGGGIGGFHNPVFNNVVPAHTHGFSTGGQSAQHIHTVNDPGHAHNYATLQQRPDVDRGGMYSAFSIDDITYGSTLGAGTGIWLNGFNQDHFHSGGTDNGSSQTNWEPRYIDMIICTRVQS